MRGKPLTNDPAEIAAIEQKERLYDAIARLSEFIEGFSNITPAEFKISPEEIVDQTEEMKRSRIELLKRKNKETEEILSESPASWFARRCKREKQKDPYFNRSAYARAERTRSEGVREHIKNIPGWNDFVGDHPVYKNIEKYIQFLDDLPEGETSLKKLLTFKGKHTPRQRNVFRRGLIEEGFIADISTEDFEYCFSEKPIYDDRPRINFLTRANHATYMLRELVDDYGNKKLNKHEIANLCLFFPKNPSTKIDSNTDPTERNEIIVKFKKIFNRTL